MFDFNILAIIAGIPGLLIALVIHEYATPKLQTGWAMIRRG